MNGTSSSTRPARAYGTALGVLVAAGVIFLLATGDDEDPPPIQAEPPPSEVSRGAPAAPRPSERGPRADGLAPPGKPIDSQNSSPAPPSAAPEPVSWDLLPAPHQPAAMRVAYAELLVALASAWPDVAFHHLELDCVAPPCLVGVEYDPDEFGAPAEYEGFVEDLPGEAADAFGFAMHAVHVAGGPEGDVVWMYALPSELGAGSPTWLDLMQGADARYQAGRAALRDAEGGELPNPGLPEQTFD